VATALERGLVVTVADNGPGFPDDYSNERGAGHGLKNVRDRMRGYFGDSRNIEWETGESGTNVSLTIPMMEHRECAS
jgi:LytS/YehU family sensor histidine kinase